MEERPVNQSSHAIDQQTGSVSASTMPSMPPPPMIPPTFRPTTSDGDLTGSAQNGDRKERKRKSRWDDS